MKPRLMIVLFAAFAPLAALASPALPEEHCKLYSSSSTSSSESDAEAQAYRYGRDRCWAYERDLGKTTTYRPGRVRCQSKTYSGGNVYWTCSYDRVECCYAP